MAPKKLNTLCECTPVAMEVERYEGARIYYEIGVGFHPGCEKCIKCECTSITMVELEEARWEVYVGVNKNCRFCSRSGKVCTDFVQMVDYGDGVVVVGSDTVEADTSGETVEPVETMEPVETGISGGDVGLEAAPAVEKAV